MDKRYDNEKEVVTLLSLGHQEAFTKLYNLYSPRLYGHLLKLVKSPCIAQELLQECFIKLWTNRSLIDPNKSFKSYIFRICENLVYDFYRRLSRDEKLRHNMLSFIQEHYQHIEENILKKENADLLETAIMTLPAQRQEVFRLCKLEGKSYDEVSLLLGISTSTISDHIVKANKALRIYLAASYRFLLPLLVVYISN